VFAEIGQILAIEDDAAMICFINTADDVQEGTFSASALTEDGDNPPTIFP